MTYESVVACVLVMSLLILTRSLCAKIGITHLRVICPRTCSDGRRKSWRHFSHSRRHHRITFGVPWISVKRSNCNLP